DRCPAAPTLCDAAGDRRPRQGRAASAVSIYRDNERLIIGGGALVAVLLLWELVSRFGLVNPIFISSPTAIARAGYALFAEGDIWRHLNVSGTEFLIGYGLAALIGVPVGIATGWWRRVSYLL